MNERDSVRLATQIKEMRENMPMLMDFRQLDAKLVRVKFLALVGQGFTEAQALDLCKEWRN